MLYINSNVAGLDQEVADGGVFSSYKTAWRCESCEKLAKLPAAERVLSKGFDILYLTDDVDEFVLQMLREYDKKEFRPL